MKTKIQKISYVLIALTLVFAMSCGGSSNSESEEHEHAESDEHNMEGMDHDMEGMDHDMEGMDHDHDEGGGHMAHMNDIKAWLKTELGDNYDEPVGEATEEQLAKGKEIFTKNCTACHGMEGKGDGPAAAALDPKPADFTDPEHSAFYSDRGRIHIITNGIEGAAMVGWKTILKEDEIHSVYMYVRSLRGSGGDDDHDHEHGEE